MSWSQMIYRLMSDSSAGGLRAHLPAKAGSHKIHSCKIHPVASTFRWKSTPDRSEDNAPERRVLQKRAGGGPVPVEVRRLFQQRDDAVDARQLDHLVDSAIVQPARHGAKCKAGANLWP